MVRIACLTIVKCFAFYGYVDLLNGFYHLYCFVGCLSMIVWTCAVLGVLYMHVFNIFVFVLVGLN